VLFFVGTQGGSVADAALLPLKIPAMTDAESVSKVIKMRMDPPCAEWIFYAPKTPKRQGILSARPR
jgi:hypothetical protein